PDSSANRPRIATSKTTITHTQPNNFQRTITLLPFNRTRHSSGATGSASAERLVIDRGFQAANREPPAAPATVVEVDRVSPSLHSTISNRLPVSPIPVEPDSCACIQ